jgi:predicted amidohydrolase YtcJ
MNPVDMKPEWILTNGNFHTQDTRQPRARAVAVGEGRFLAVGEDKEIRELAARGTEIIDLEGKTAIPGMTDAHFHYYDWALGRKELALGDVAHFQELLDRVKARAQETPAGHWIVGQGWNESDWPEHRMPTRDDLDAAAPGHPVALWRCDLHLAAVNSRALELAGINENTPNPPDGVIARDGSGRLNGILRELATNLVKKAIPSPTDGDLTAVMAEGIPVLHAYGLTGLHDIHLMGGLEAAPAFRAWQRLRETGMLKLRTWVSIPGESLDEAVALGLRTGLGDDILRIGHLKYFADGGMGARTAWMIDPYLDAECGMPLGSLDALKEAFVRADQAGLAVMVHAIGERANREVIGIFEKVFEARRAPGGTRFPAPAVRHRMEHVQMIRPEDISRLARLDLIACVQPHNMILDINMIDECVGARGAFTYAYREMIDTGIPVIFSSDAPVCDPRPLVGIHALVTRRRKDGTPEGGWYPESRLTVEEAVRGYTLLPALTHGLGNKLGSIAAGKYADLVVLDRDIYTIDPMEILDARVDLTIFDGRIVYRREDRI